MKKLILITAILAGLPATSIFANSEMAQVLTHTGQPVNCLAPVKVTKIDGKQTQVSHVRFEIEPGLHTINGQAKLNTAFCSIAHTGLRGGFAPDLEVDFEAGKTYTIWYDHSSKSRDEWKLVVWKVE